MGNTHHKHIRITESEWDDLRFPSQGLNPPGAASDPARNTNDGFLEFSDSAVNTIAGLAQLPHSWKEGTYIYPHIHAGPKTNAGGNAVWQLEYQWIATSGQFVSANISTHIYIDVGTVPNINTIHNVPTSGVSGSGMKISSLFWWKLSRMGDNTSDDGPVIKFYEFDIHYEKETFGSDKIYTKTLP